MTVRWGAHLKIISSVYLLRESMWNVNCYTKYVTDEVTFKVDFFKLWCYRSPTVWSRTGNKSTVSTFFNNNLKKRRQTIPILDLGPKSQLISDPGSRTLFEESVEAALIHSHTTSGCISVRVNVLFSWRDCTFFFWHTVIFSSVPTTIFTLTSED